MKPFCTSIFLSSILLGSCVAYDSRTSGTTSTGDATTTLIQTPNATLRPSAYPEGCLQGYAGESTDLLALEMPCLATDSNALWFFDGNRISGTGGRCLSADASDANNAMPVELSACSATDSRQVFSITQGLIRSQVAGACLDANFLNMGSPPRSLLRACDPNNQAQQWAFLPVTNSNSVEPVLPLNPEIYITTPDLTKKLSLTPSDTSTDFSADVTLAVDTNKQFQRMIGGGASLTDSSSFLLASKLSDAVRADVLEKLFHPTKGIGVVMLRQPMGASDFSTVGDYSFDEMPADQMDLDLVNFNLDQDKKATLPLLRQIQTLAPDLFILGTPWSPPSWMKSNKTMDGGGAGKGFAGLNNNCYQPLANYFVKFIQGYKAEGVTVHAITPQNEPLFDSSGYPGMSLMEPYEAQLIANNLGPAFKAAKLTTQIWGYDHNWDAPDYPLALAKDANVSPYLGGMAYHCYAGDPGVMSDFHSKYPNIDIHLTECSGGGWQPNAFTTTMDNILYSTMNWARSMILWNLVLDKANGPQNKGCSQCRGLVTVDQTTGAVDYTTDYYAMGHFTKFVRPDAVRVDVTVSPKALSVAFQNKNGSIVVMSRNRTNDALGFVVTAGGKTLKVKVPANAAATFFF